MNANLSYMLSRVQAVSTQTFKLEPQNSNTATASQQIRVAIPSNTLLNTRSCKLLANVTTTGEGTRLPAKINSLIDRISLECGGVVIDGAALQEYGVLCHAKAIHEGSKDGPLSHPNMVREQPYHNGVEQLNGTGAKLTDDNPETYPNKTDSFCFTFDYSFLGSCMPAVIDTSLVPDMILVISLASDAVLSTVAGPTMANYAADGGKDGMFQLNNIRVLCEALALGSGVYDQLVARKLSESVLEIPFKTIYDSSGHTQSINSFSHLLSVS